MNKRDVMKADGSSHSLFDLPCPSKVREPFALHESRAPLLMRCYVGWINGERNCLQTDGSCLCCDRECGRLSRTLTVPWPTRHGLCHHVPPPTLSRHTDDDLTWLCATHVISLGGGWLWELVRTRAAGEGQQTVSNSRPGWEMLGVRRPVAFLHVLC